VREGGTISRGATEGVNECFGEVREDSLRGHSPSGNRRTLSIETIKIRFRYFLPSQEKKTSKK